MVGMPKASRLSFTSTGMPCSGPRTLPRRRSTSRARASANAAGLSLRTALRPGSRRLSASMRSTYASVSSTEVSSTGAHEVLQLGDGGGLEVDDRRPLGLGRPGAREEQAGQQQREGACARQDGSAK